MNFSPEMFKNYQNMMNPSMMKAAADNINNMSDDQLRVYLSQTGKF
jgi:hypothetical protein